jgi:hypothetical protein
MLQVELVAAVEPVTDLLAEFKAAMQQLILVQAAVVTAVLLFEVVMAVQVLLL